jgi:hypothetical protein
MFLPAPLFALSNCAPINKPESNVFVHTKIVNKISREKLWNNEMVAHLIVVQNQLIQKVMEIRKRGKLRPKNLIYFAAALYLTVSLFLMEIGLEGQ